MKDHETIIVKKIEEKNQKLWEESCRIKDDVFRKASLPEKIHVYLTMMAIGIVMFYPIYMGTQLIQLPEKIHTFLSMVGFTLIIGFPVYVLAQLMILHRKR